MLGLDRVWKRGEGSAEGPASLPPGWIGAPSLQNLTLHLQELETGEAGSIGELAAALFAVDDESRALLQAERSRYVDLTGSGVARGEVVWKIGRGFLEELFSALSELLLRDCYAGREGDLSEAGRTELLVRVLRAGAEGVVWDAIHYGPFNEAGWVRLGQVFALALERANADGEVLLPGSAHDLTTPRREFLYAVAVRCAGFDGLPVERMERVDGAIRQYLGHLSLRQGDSTGALFRLVVGDGGGPRRMAGATETGPTWWFFSAAAAIEAWQEEMACGGQPGWAMAHLLHQWGPRPPARRHQRHSMAGRLGLVQCWEDLLASLCGLADPLPDSASFENVSRDGLSARAPTDSAFGARVGDVIGVRPQGGAAWQLSVVRRIQRSKDQSMLLGVETLTRSPRVVEADDGRTATRAVVCDPVRPGRLVRFLAPPNVFRKGAPLFLKIGSGVLKLEPQGKAIRARFCELQSFRVL